jgi:hypothetical protein
MVVSDLPQPWDVGSRSAGATVAVLHLGRCRPVRPHIGVNQRSVQVGDGSIGVMLLEYRMVILHSGKLRPLGRNNGLSPTVCE